MVPPTAAATSAVAVPPSTTGPALVDPLTTKLSVTVGLFISILISRPILLLITRSPLLLTSALKPGKVVVCNKLISSAISSRLVDVSSWPFKNSVMLLPGLL